MLKSAALLIAFSTAAAAPAGAVRVPVTLRGSPASMVRQNEVAKENELTFLRTPAQVQEFVAAGKLVPLPGSADYQVAKGTGWPYARPETRNFVERLAPQYHAACGTPMVVTSATRPLDRQPKNAHKLSVHPTGMAVDLRVPKQARCLGWLETKLLAMETAGELDATHEIHPAHFHIAVFPAGFRTPTTSASLHAGAGHGEDAQVGPAAAGTQASGGRQAAGAAAAKQDAGQPARSALATLGGIALSAGILFLILRGRRRDGGPVGFGGAAEREHDRAA
ncbi:MAG: hypothetical protein JWM27_2042 [Gemmatimonadetes bacterium]|nr:hypothetical protein [Gemmatimonadota bacterium]